METSIQQSITLDIVEQAKRLYDIVDSSLEFLGGFENFVYQYAQDGKHYIMRFVHSSHREYNQVLAELEFIDYLDANNACVSTVIHSINDRIAEKIDISDTDYITLCVFEKAPGKYVEEQDITNDFLHMFGQEVGRLHHLAKTFKPAHHRVKWFQENYYQMAQKHLSTEDQDILLLLEDVTARIRELPEDHDGFGLIHTDLHFHNMYYDGSKLTFFDFDDSAYMYFISDIAIILYYRFANRLLLDENYKNSDYQLDAKNMLFHLMVGYKQVNQIDVKWFYHMNDFILLRSVILYVVLVAAGYHNHEDERYRQYVHLAKERALNHSMKLDLDFVLEGL